MKAKEIQKELVWFANGESTWKRDIYTIYSGVMGFSAWRFGPNARKLGDAQTFKAAAKICEADHPLRERKEHG